MREIHLISLGAGVQSSTMALMAAAGELKPMPEAFKAAVEFEARLQRAVASSTAPTSTNGLVYLHPKRKPLMEVELDGESGREWFGQECEGMCGV